MALRDIFKKSTTELADKTKPTQSGLTAEVGVAGEVLFTGFENEEQRTDNITIQNYRKMYDKDGTVQSLYNILTLPILATSYKIRADENDAGETQADFVRKNLLEPPHKGGMETPFDLFLEQLMRAFLDGFQLFEKVYAIKDGKYVLKKLANRDSIGIWLKRDEFGGFGGANQRVMYENDYKWIEMDAYKLFLFTYGKAHSYLYGRSAFKAAYVNYDKKRRLEYLDSISIQNDAIKAKILRRTVEGVLGKDAKSARNKALAALAKLGETKPVAAIPYGYEVDTLDGEGRDAGPSIERQNSEMARSLLAQFILLGTQGSSSVGSFALSESSSDIFKIALKGTMQNIENHINNYLIPDLIDLNFPTPAYPEFHFDDLTSDVMKVMTDAFLQLVKGNQISEEMVKGIEQAAASRLEIDTDKIRKDIDRQAKKDAKKNGGDGTGNPGNPQNPTNPGGNGASLSDVSSNDFPGLYEGMVNTDDLGCIMLDVQTFDITKHVEGADQDLYVNAANPDSHSQGAVAETEAHITLLYGLLENGNTIKAKVDQVLNGWSIDSVTIDDVSSFPVAADAPSVPIIANLWSSNIEDAHDRLSLLPHVNTFSRYNPHITLAYVKNDPDTVQKWVVALRTALAGMRLNTIGINYGDEPEDDANDGGAAGSGSKFPDKQLSDQQWHRDLTPAEQTIKLADLNSRMDTLESQFVTSMQPIVSVITKQLAEQTAAAKSPTDINVTLPADYTRTIMSTIKTAYNFGKTGAADENKVAAPTTDKDALTGINDLTQFVVDKQQDDLKNLLRSEYLKAKRTAQLADPDQQDDTTPPETQPKDQVGAFQTALEVLLGTWFLTKLKATAGAIVSQAINNGRDDVFKKIAKDGDVFQYSAILDGKCTSGICPPLDGLVADRAQYEATKWRPPLHFHCRCIWVLIRKLVSGKTDTAIPDVTGMPDDSNGFNGPQL